MSPRMPICTHSRRRPSGNWRVPCTELRSRRCSNGAMSGTLITQPIQPPPISERARTACPKAALSAAG